MTEVSWSHSEEKMQSLMDLVLSSTILAGYNLKKNVCLSRLTGQMIFGYLSIQVV